MAARTGTGRQDPVPVRPYHRAWLFVQAGLSRVQEYIHHEQPCTFLAILRRQLVPYVWTDAGGLWGFFPGDDFRQGVLQRSTPQRGNRVGHSQSGGVVSAAIQEDGSYTISKVPIGPATVTVETMSLRPTARAAMPGPYANAPKDVMPGARSQGDEKRYVPIPEQYSDPESSGLTLDVKKGTQQHDIDLK